METARNSRIKIDLAQLFEQQVEFFRRRTLGETTPAEQRDYEKRRERIRQFCRARQIDKGSIGDEIAAGFAPGSRSELPFANPTASSHQSGKFRGPQC